MLGEAQDEVEVPHAPAAAQIVLRTALSERDEPESVTPHLKVRIASKEVVELCVSQTTEPLEVRIVDRRVRASVAPA